MSEKQMKTILITGGSDGLGKAIAKDLAKDNKVIILARNEEKLQAVSKELKCDYFVCDVVNHQQIEDVVGKIIAKYKRIDVLINCAGLMIRGDLDASSFEEIQSVIDVNLIGLIKMTKACLPVMKKNKNGLIININSQSASIPRVERTIYNASKCGVAGFTKSLQLELADYGIRVTDVLSGKMDTPMTKGRDLSNAMQTSDVTRLIRFIVETPRDIVITDVGIKNINK